MLVLFNRNKFAQLITVVTLRVCRSNQTGLIPDQTEFILLFITENVITPRVCFARLVEFFFRIALPFPNTRLETNQNIVK